MEEPADPLRGAILCEYRLERVIGEGGMGTVWAARHVRLERTAAVKVLQADHARDRKLLRRFFAEAKVIGELRHPGLVEVLDCGEDPPCIVMELLVGRALDDVIAAEGAMPLPRAAGIVRQVLLALAVVHEHGIVHRDLKPANLFLVPGDDGPTVKVLDFGIAKLADAAQHGISKTTTGKIVGTPQYMAPEHIEGHAIDGRADVYALGVIFHQLLTGEAPFQGPTMAALFHQHLMVRPPAPSARRAGIPPAIDGFVLRCLEKLPRDRFASAAEALRALDAALASPGEPAADPAPRPAPAPAPAPEPVTVEQRPARRRRGRTLALGGAIAAAAIAFAVIAWRGGGEPPARPAASPPDAGPVPRVEHAAPADAAPAAEPERGPTREPARRRPPRAAAEPEPQPAAEPAAKPAPEPAPPDAGADDERGLTIELPGLLGD